MFESFGHSSKSGPMLGPAFVPSASTSWHWNPFLIGSEGQPIKRGNGRAGQLSYFIRCQAGCTVGDALKYDFYRIAWLGNMKQSCRVPTKKQQETTSLFFWSQPTQEMRESAETSLRLPESKPAWAGLAPSAGRGECQNCKGRAQGGHSLSFLGQFGWIDSTGFFVDPMFPRGCHISSSRLHLPPFGPSMPTQKPYVSPGEREPQGNNPLRSEI